MSAFTARQELHDLAFRYAFAVDHLDADMLASIFVTDGMTGGAGNTSYNVTKGAVLRLTRSIAADYAAVSPVYIETPMTGMLEHPGPVRDAFVGLHLMNRPGQPHEVAMVICFLLSDEASFITGANFRLTAAFPPRR